MDKNNITPGLSDEENQELEEYEQKLEKKKERAERLGNSVSPYVNPALLTILISALVFLAIGVYLNRGGDKNHRKTVTYACPYKGNIEQDKILKHKQEIKQFYEEFFTSLEKLSPRIFYSFLVDTELLELTDLHGDMEAAMQSVHAKEVRIDNFFQLEEIKAKLDQLNFEQVINEYIAAMSEITKDTYRPGQALWTVFNCKKGKDNTYCYFDQYNCESLAKTYAADLFYLFEKEVKSGELKLYFDVMYVYEGEDNANKDDMDRMQEKNLASHIRLVAVYNNQVYELEAGEYRVSDIAEFEIDKHDLTPIEDLFDMYINPPQNPPGHKYSKGEKTNSPFTFPRKKNRIEHEDQWEHDKIIEETLKLMRTGNLNFDVFLRAFRAFNAKGDFESKKFQEFRKHAKTFLPKLKKEIKIISLKMMLREPGYEFLEIDLRENLEKKYSADKTNTVALYHISLIMWSMGELHRALDYLWELVLSSKPGEGRYEDALREIFRINVNLKRYMDALDVDEYVYKIEKEKMKKIWKIEDIISKIEILESVYGIDYAIETCMSNIAFYSEEEYEETAVELEKFLEKLKGRRY
jgi:hypothetical protein